MQQTELATHPFFSAHSVSVYHIVSLLFGICFLLFVYNKPIYLSLDTDGTVIYYTLNGTKPQPFQTIGPAAKSTVLYQEPFLLPAGKRTIKAVAVTRSHSSTDVDLDIKICDRKVFNFCQMRDQICPFSSILSCCFHLSLTFFIFVE